MGIFSDDLEQVYGIVIKHKLHQTGLQEAKLIKDWLEHPKMVSQSFYISSGIVFSRNNDLLKILLYRESFTLRRMQWWLCCKHFSDINFY